MVLEQVHPDVGKRSTCENATLQDELSHLEMRKVATGGTSASVANVASVKNVESEKQVASSGATKKCKRRQSKHLSPVANYVMTTVPKDQAWRDTTSA